MITKYNVGIKKQRRLGENFSSFGWNFSIMCSLYQRSKFDKSEDAKCAEWHELTRPLNLVQSKT